MFTSHVCDVRETEQHEFNTCKYIIYSTQKTTQHKRKFAQTIAECRESLVKLTQIAARYRCRSNNRTREISLKNRSKRNFANYRGTFANFAELRLHYFSTILYSEIKSYFHNFTLKSGPFISANFSNPSFTNFFRFPYSLAGDERQVLHDVASSHCTREHNSGH